MEKPLKKVNLAQFFRYLQYKIESNYEKSPGSIFVR